MTQQEALQIFGDSIPVKYMDNSGVYHSVTANAVTSGAVSSIQIANQWTDETGYMIANRQFLCYQFETEGTLNAEPRNVTVDITCQYTIFDTEYIYTAAAMPCSSTNITAYNSPAWDWYWAGSSVVFSPSDLANNNVLPQVYFSGWCDFIPAYMQSQALTSGYSMRITFDHASLASGRYCRFYVGLPYVSADAQGVTGTPANTTATTTSPSVDLGETNGLLGGISSAISGIVSRVQEIYTALVGDGSSVQDAEPIDSIPESLDYDQALDDADQIMIDADQILEDVPEVTEAWAVYWDLLDRFFSGDAVIFAVLIPVACLLSMLSYMLWRG